MANELLEKIEAEKWLALIEEYGQKPLSDPSALPQEKVYSVSGETNLLNGALKFKGGADVGVALLNAESDIDEVNVSNKKVNDQLQSPLLLHSSSDPLIRYRLQVKMDGELGLETSWQLPLKLDGSAKALFGLYNYVSHRGTATFLEAAVADRKDFYRTALRYQDVVSLQPGQAVAMDWSGGVSVKASINWADLIGGILSRVQPVFSKSGPIAVKLSANVATEMSLTIDDVFTLVFAHRKGGAKPWVVDLRKRDASDLSVGLSLGVGIDTSISKQAAAEIAKVRNSIATKLLGVTKPRLDELRAWVNSDIDVPAALAPYLDKLRGRLTGEIDATEAEIKEKAKEWLDKVEHAIVSTAEQSLKASIAWSYRRVKVRDVLIRHAFALEEFKRDIGEEGHSALRAGRISELQRLAREEAGDFYLSTLAKTAVSGFSAGISIGSLTFSFARLNEAKVEWETRPGDLWRPRFTRDLSQEGRSKREIHARKIGISVSGREFLPADAQTLSNLQFDLTLNYTNFDGDAKEDELADYLDTARIWGALPPGKEEFEKIKQQLLAKEGDLKFVCSLVVPHDALLAAFSDDPESPASRDLWGDAIALSMMAYRIEQAFLDLKVRKAAFDAAADYLVGPDRNKGGARNQIKERVCASLEGKGLNRWRDLESRVAIAINARERAINSPYSTRPQSIQGLRSESIVAMHFRYRKKIGHLSKVHQRIWQLRQSAGKEIDRPSLQGEIESLLSDLKKVRNSLVLFRAIGVFVRLRLKKTTDAIGEPSSGVVGSFQIVETNRDGEAVGASSYA